MIRGTRSPGSGIDTTSRLAEVRTIDGATVVRSELDASGRVQRRYLDPTLAPLIGVLPRGGLAVGFERVVARRRPPSTEPIVLTIDSRVQRAVADAIGSRNAAAAVMTMDGGIVAGVDNTTTPVDDPNTLASGKYVNIDEPFSLYPPDRQPVLNKRPVACGSTLKPLIFATPSASGVLSPDDTFPAARGHAPAGGRWITNYGDQLCPEMNAAGGVARSCNSVALTVAERLGPSGVRESLRSFGFGLPSPDADLFSASMPALEGGWPSTVDEMSLATLGQGEARVTLLGLAAAYTALLGPGGVARPHLEAHSDVGPLQPRPITDEDAAISFDGMRAVSVAADDAPTVGSLHGHTAVDAVVYTEPRTRSSLSHRPTSPFAARSAPSTSSRSSLASIICNSGSTSPRCSSSIGRSWVITHSHTFGIDMPEFAATHNNDDNKISTWVNQKSPPPSIPLRGAASHNAFAAARAPDVDAAARNGDQRAEDIFVGANTFTSPTWARHRTVDSNKSFFTDDRIAGPSHSKIPEMAAVVLPHRDGPMNATAPRSPCRARALRCCTTPPAGPTARFSVATNLRPTRPSTNRPTTGRPTTNGASSRALANRASVSTPSRRRGS